MIVPNRKNHANGEDALKHPDLVSAYRQHCDKFEHIKRAYARDFYKARSIMTFSAHAKAYAQINVCCFVGSRRTLHRTTVTATIEFCSAYMAWKEFYDEYVAEDKAVDHFHEYHRAAGILKGYEEQLMGSIHTKQPLVRYSGILPSEEDAGFVPHTADPRYIRLVAAFCALYEEYRMDVNRARPKSAETYAMCFRT